MASISIKDIARAANVSHPTVSRALRDSPLVSAETAERIRRIAEEMGYRPSAIGRSLVTQKTDTIGVVVTTVTDPFIAEVVSVVEEVANDYGYSILLANSNANPSREMKVVHLFHERRVDGVLVMASRVGALYMPLLSKMKVPIVLIDNQHPEEFVHSVLIDNLNGSRQATEHLIQLGHKRIAYIGDEFGFQSQTERLAGYRHALKAAKLPRRPELIVKGNGKVDGGIRAMQELLKLSTLPTAVFCYNDMTAFGALHAIRSHGLRVPEDFSLVGFDDISFASYTDPPLTTVRQPKEQMGRLAVESLIDFSAGENQKTSTVVQGELVVRKSTGSSAP